MSLALKIKIIEKFGTQWEFARSVDDHESVVSRAIKDRQPLSDEKKQKWADALNVGVREIFPE